MIKYCLLFREYGQALDEMGRDYEKRLWEAQNQEKAVRSRLHDVQEGARVRIQKVGLF